MKPLELEQISFDALTIPSEIVTGVDGKGELFVLKFGFPDPERAPIIIVIPIAAAKQLISDMTQTLHDATQLGIINDQRGTTEEAS